MQARLKSSPRKINVNFFPVGIPSGGTFSFISFDMIIKKKCLLKKQFSLGIKFCVVHQTCTSTVNALFKGNTKFWEILKIGWIVILYNFDIFGCPCGCIIYKH